MKSNTKTIGARILTCLLLSLFVFSYPIYADGYDNSTDAANTQSSVNANDLPEGVEYITPEQFGAKGDGKTDDTAAFEKCMRHSTKYILLKGQYLISRYLTTNKEKYLYAVPQNGYAGASIICNVKADSKALAFTNVTFENIEFYSTLLRTGKSPHGESYKRTSNLVFVEVWNGNATFNNCFFIHSLIAIRGRKSSNSSVIPNSIVVNGCTFTECKIPIQGYSKCTEVKNSEFINDGELYRKLDKAKPDANLYNGDVYSGDHCVYMEAYGCKSVKISNCKVKTLNSESGASFQIYGKQATNDAVPSLLIESCKLDSNGVASASKANVEIKDVVFNEQKAEKYIMWIESGSAVLKDSVFNHSYAFSYASSSVKPYAEGCTFKLLTSLSRTRCNFPFESKGCTFINWGGNVRVNNTSFSNCVFTSETATVLNKLYIGNPSKCKISIIDTKFKKGSTITNNTTAVTTYSGCSIFN